MAVIFKFGPKDTVDEDELLDNTSNNLQAVAIYVGLLGAVAFLFYVVQFVSTYGGLILLGG